MTTEKKVKRNRGFFYQGATITSLTFILVLAFILIFALKDFRFTTQLNPTSPATTPDLSPSGAAYSTVISSNPTNSATPQATATSTPNPSTTLPPTTPLPAGTPGQPGNWRLIFSDEFNADSLDTNTWVTCYWWDKNGCTNAGNKELEWYQPGNVEVEQGLLRLRAQKQVVQASDGKTYNYTSGMVTTGSLSEGTPEKTRFAFEYGYVEIRAKIPYGKSLWPSIWLLPVTQKWPPEIDIMELVGDYPMTVNMTTHFIQPDGTNGEKGGKWTGPDFGASFHIFGLSWTPQAITWYIDGIPRQSDQAKTHIPTEKMYLILNLAVGGNWPGNPDSKTIFPAYFDIDYVRVWQR